MTTQTTTVDQPTTYRFSGSILTSDFPGVLAGDRLFGRLRYGSALAAGVATVPGHHFADPKGFVEAIVGAVQLHSAGPFEIRLLDGPAMLRLALMARRPSPGEALIAVGAAMLVSPPPHADLAMDMLRSGRFVTRSFTVESSEIPGVATGALDMLYPIEDATA